MQEAPTSGGPGAKPTGRVWGRTPENMRGDEVRAFRGHSSGNIWASKAGMSTKDLMARMGHDDMRAALIYQRATSDADKLIAERLSALVDEHRKKGKKAAKKAKKKRRKGDEDGPAVPVA